MRLDDIKEELDGIGKIIGKYNINRKQMMSKDRTFCIFNDKKECDCDRETYSCEGNPGWDDKPECQHCYCVDNPKYCDPYSCPCNSVCDPDDPYGCITDPCSHIDDSCSSW